MTRIEALKALLAKVEAGEAMFGDFFAMEGPPLNLDEMAVDAANAYHGSLDAAKALHEAVLPDWWVQYMGENLKGWGIRLGSNAYGEIPSGVLIPRANNLALAWLIAIIRALIAQEEASVV